MTDTDKIAAEMLAGLEGVTPGEWQWVVENYSQASLGVGDDPGNGTPLVLGVAPCRSCAERRKETGWEWGACQTPTLANAAHIARCNPVNIKALLDERAADKALMDEMGEALDSLADAMSRYEADIDPELEPPYAHRDLMHRVNAALEEWRAWK